MEQIDWKTCKHVWEESSNPSHARYQCSECFVFSNIGPNFFINSIFLTGMIKKKLIIKRRTA